MVPLLPLAPLFAPHLLILEPSPNFRLHPAPPATILRLSQRPPQNPSLCEAVPSWASPAARSPARSSSFAPIPRTWHPECAAAISAGPGCWTQTRGASKSPQRGATPACGSAPAPDFRLRLVSPNCCFLPLGIRPAFCPPRIQCPQTPDHVRDRRFPVAQLPARLSNKDAPSVSTCARGLPGFPLPAPRAFFPFP